MIAEKIIETTLTVNDFSLIRSKNIENIVLGMLKNIYKNKCYQKCFIVDVVRILNIKDMEFNQNDISHCSFNINVLFIIVCEYFIHAEPIMDMKILNIKQTAVTLGSDNKIAVVKEFSMKDVEQFKVGDYIPVKAIKCIYEPCSEKIKIGCVLINMTDYDVESFYNSTNEDNKFKIKKIHKNGVSQIKESVRQILEYNEKSFNLENGINDDNNVKSFKELFEAHEDDLNDGYICFSVDLKQNKYNNRIKLLSEDNIEKCKEIDQLELFSLIADQYVYRNTVNSLSSLYDSEYYKDKNILQSCKIIYNK
jgi:hypothetical protein